MTVPAQPATLDALRAIVVLLDGIDHSARGRLDAEQRLELVEIARHIARRADALTRVLVAEADASQSSTIAKGTPTTSWLAADPATARGEAAGLVFSGHELVDEPRLRDASLNGVVSTPQARLVAKAFREVPEALDPAQEDAVRQDLLDHAAQLHPSRVRQAVREALRRCAPQAVPSAEDEQERLDAQGRRARAWRYLRLTHDGDGGIDLRGSLPALEAEPLRVMLNTLVESERHRHRTAHDRRDPPGQITPDQRRADAFISLLALAHQGLASPAVSFDGPVVADADPMPPAGAVPAAAGTRPAPRAGLRPRVVVTMTETALRDRAEQVGLLPEGISIGAGELRRMCCDADLVPVVLGTRTQPLDVGRAHRLVTPGIRQALTLRDGGCVFPGCEASDHRCEAHHLTPWWDGGVTALHNLVLLCTHHHGLVEPPRFFSATPPDRWEIRLDDDGIPEIIPPARMDRHRRPIPRTNPHGPGQQMREGTTTGRQGHVLVA